MTIDTDTMEALRTIGLPEGADSAAAEAFMGKLTDAQKATVAEQSRENRIVRRTAEALMPTLEKNQRTLHARIDKIGAPITPGAKPEGDGDGEGEGKDGDGKGKGKKATVPPGYVPKSEVDKLREEIRVRDIRAALSTLLAKEKLMPGAHEDALAALARGAKMDEQTGQIVIERTVVENGESVVRQLTPGEALAALRGEKKFLFAAGVADGMGGGGDRDGPAGASGYPPISWQELVNDPELMNKYLGDPRGQKEYDRARAAWLAEKNKNIRGRTISPIG